MKGILGHIVKDGNVSFRNYREGDYEPSWEPSRNVTEEFIYLYLAQNGREDPDSGAANKK